MAYLTQPDYVKYICSCGQLKPITNLYFCRHCLKIRCGFCICHEVDSHYCANCLENMPSSEARLKKNRCSSCFDCPSCFHTLSTRATLTQPRQSINEAGDAKVENKQPKKMYYLSCFNCRWTSRDVGIPDQPVASGGWPERSNPFAGRMNQLLEYYKAIALQEKHEKMEKERKKFTIRGKYITLTDKTGLTGAMARTIAGLPPGDAAPAGFAPSQASEHVEPLPDDFYTREVNLNQITSMSQRLAAPERQPALVSRLQPLPKLLSVKRSQRCRACDHNLTKPEYNPGSIKYKIELLAYFHVPEVKIISHESVRPGENTALLVKLTNPTGYEMQVELMPPCEVPPEEERDPPASATLENTLEKSLNIEKEVWHKSVELGAQFAASSALATRAGALAVPQRDDAAEYDEDAAHDTNEHIKSKRKTHKAEGLPPWAMVHMDLGVIMWRKSNKLGLRLEVWTPASAAPGAPAAVPLQLRYSYRNAVPPPAHAHAHAHAQPSHHTLYATALLSLGTVQP